MEHPVFTKEQFLTEEPYEYLSQLKKDPFRHEQALAVIKGNAHAVGVRNFRRLYMAFLKSRKSGRENR